MDNNFNYNSDISNIEYGYEEGYLTIEDIEKILQIIKEKSKKIENYLNLLSAIENYLNLLSAIEKKEVKKNERINY